MKRIALFDLFNYTNDSSKFIQAYNYNEKRTAKEFLKKVNYILHEQQLPTIWHCASILFFKTKPN